MCLIALKLFERREVRIFVVEVDHKSDRNQIVAKMIEERTATCLIIERPAYGVLDQARLMLAGLDFPQFLETNSIFLRLAARIQIKSGDQLL